MTHRHFLLKYVALLSAAFLAQNLLFAQTDQITLRKPVLVSTIAKKQGVLGFNISVETVKPFTPGGVWDLQLSAFDPIFDEPFGTALTPFDFLPGEPVETALFFLPAAWLQPNGDDNRVSLGLAATLHTTEPGDNSGSTLSIYSDTLFATVDLPPYEWIVLRYGGFSLPRFRPDGRPWNITGEFTGEDPQFCWQLARGETTYFTSYPSAENQGEAGFRYPETPEIMFKYFKDELWDLHIMRANEGVADEYLYRVELEDAFQKIPYEDVPVAGPVTGGALTMVRQVPDTDPYVTGWKLTGSRTEKGRWRLKGQWEKATEYPEGDWGYQYKPRFRYKGQVIPIEMVYGNKKTGNPITIFDGIFGDDPTVWLVDTIAAFEPDSLQLEILYRRSLSMGDSTYYDGFGILSQKVNWKEPEKDPETLAIIITAVAALGLLWTMFGRRVRRRR